MLTDREQKLVNWLRKHRNTAYYPLADVPCFDDWGLWTYRNVCFSRAGTLLDTLVALVSAAPAGLTAAELEQRLQTPVANLLSRLVHNGRLQRQMLRGRQVVYLNSEPGQGRQQREQRQAEFHAAAAKASQGLPAGCPAPLIIDVLRQMMRSCWRFISGSSITATTGGDAASPLIRTYCTCIAG